MYVCLDCGNTFDTPKEWIEKHGLDSPPYEKIIGCPKCGGNFVVAPLCDVCGEEIVDDYYSIENGMNICNECCSKTSLGL